MAGRVFAFSDPEIIQMAQRDFIPVAADDWYQRRRQDEEGEYFRAVSSQRLHLHPNSTRQGIYCFTPGGLLLEFKNAGQNTEVMQEVFRSALKKWKALPESERLKPAPSFSGPVDPRYHRQLPPDALVLKVLTRALDRDAKGNILGAVCKPGAGNETATDHLWLTASEAASLLPGDVKRGDRYPLPSRIATRLLRFHLVDNTRGEPVFWRAEDVRRSRLELVVDQVTPQEILLILDGTALLSTSDKEAEAERGFDASLTGRFVFSKTQSAWNQMEILAVGDHWGEGPYTRGARPGKTPLGIYVGLVKTPTPIDMIPPQAARDLWDYLPKSVSRN